MRTTYKKQRKTTPGGRYVNVVNVDDDKDLEHYANRQKEQRQRDYAYNRHNNSYRNDAYDGDNWFMDDFDDSAMEDGGNDFIDNNDGITQVSFDDEPVPTISADQMPDDELQVEAFKLANNVSKLMSDVTSDDVTNITDKIKDYIRNFKVPEKK